MIVLKHLAQEFKLDPHRVRQELRALLGKRSGRWTWEDNDPQLSTIRNHLTSLSKSSSSSSPASAAKRSQSSQGAISTTPGRHAGTSMVAGSRSHRKP